MPLRRLIFIMLAATATLLLSSCSNAEPDLKIISFNIRYNSWNNIDDANGWPFRKEAVVNMILQEHPDAIGLQEALVDQLLYLDSSLPTYRRVGVGRDDGNEGGEFMAIYYDTTRLENVGYNTYWLSETPVTATVPYTGRTDTPFRRAVRPIVLLFVDSLNSKSTEAKVVPPRLLLI